MSAITPDTAKAELWRQGILTWKLHETQLQMYEAFLQSKAHRFVCNCSRQIGKSYFLCVLAIGEALRNPGIQIKYAAPTQKMVKRIIFPIFRQILEDCPEDIRPNWHAQDGQYYFKNGSQIDIAGADAGNAESLRGTRMHLGIVDEAGFVADLEYLIRDIFLPMTLTTNGKIILASTPPKYPRHPFEYYYYEAVKENSYIHRTIYDNPLISKQEIKRFITESGGEDTTTWKREYLAQFVVDEKLVVIPEFTHELEQRVVADVKRPDHFDFYVSMDVGSRDYTALLFGYWDFLQARLVVEDEIFLSGSKEVRTDIIANQIRTKEEELYGNKRPYYRIADRELLLINDLDKLYGIRFVESDKDGKEASVNELRIMLQNEKVIIHPRCTNLISHLRSAVWDTKREKFARISGFGHFDGVDALLYMLRNVQRGHNPYPINRNFSPNLHYTSKPVTKSKTALIFQNIFKR